MRRPRKRRTPPGVSLFPFLAVLICTLGVLIVMLVIAVKAADSSASNSTAEAEEAIAAERARLLDDQAELVRATLDHIDRGVVIFNVRRPPASAHAALARRRP